MGFTEHILIFPGTGAQHDELHILGKDLVQDGSDQVQTLVIGQTGDHGDHRDIRIDRQTQHFLQTDLVLFLTFQIIDRIILEQVRILLRIVEIIIDTIDDTADLGTLGADDVLQAVAVELILQLFRVGRADGGDPVGRKDTGLQEVDAAAKIQITTGEIFTRQTQDILGDIVRENTLILDVVDRQHGLDVLVRCADGLVEMIQIDRDHGCLPVIAVDDIRLEVDILDDLQHCFREERKTFRIVKMTVQATTPEVILVVQQIICNLADLGFENAAVLTAPCQRDPDLLNKMHGVFHFLRNLLIQRQDDTCADHLFTEGRWQSASYIS